MTTVSGHVSEHAQIESGQVSIGIAQNRNADVILIERFQNDASAVDGSGSEQETTTLNLHRLPGFQVQGMDRGAVRLFEAIDE